MNQHIHTTPTGQQVLLVEVPEGARDLSLFQPIYGQQLLCTDKFDYSDAIDLPDGEKWQIVGKASALPDYQEAVIAFGLKPETTVVLTLNTK